MSEVYGTTPYCIGCGHFHTDYPTIVDGESVLECFAEDCECVMPARMLAAD